MRWSVHMHLLFVAVFFISIGQSYAQSQSSQKESVKVYFHQSATRLDPHYRNNEILLRRFIDVVNESRYDSLSDRSKVRIVTSVSPEGLDIENERILKGRAATIQKWIDIYSTKPVDYVVEYVGIDWDRLIKLVEESEDSRNFPCRSEVLDLLRNTPESVDGVQLGFNWRFAQLAKLHDGKPYFWLRKNLFPELRYATAELISDGNVKYDAPSEQIATGSVSSEATISPPPLAE